MALLPYFRYANSTPSLSIVIVFPSIVALVTGLQAVNQSPVTNSVMPSRHDAGLKLREVEEQRHCRVFTRTV